MHKDLFHSPLSTPANVHVLSRSAGIECHQQPLLHYRQSCTNLWRLDRKAYDSRALTVPRRWPKCIDSFALCFSLVLFDLQYPASSNANNARIAIYMEFSLQSLHVDDELIMHWYTATNLKAFEVF